MPEANPLGTAALVTSQLASQLYDPLKNALETGNGNSVLYRLTPDQAEASPLAGNVSVSRGTNLWPLALGLIVAVILFKT